MSHPNPTQEYCVNKNGKCNDIKCYCESEVKSPIIDFLAGGWKEELSKRSNIRIYDERGLSNQDYLGQW